MSVQAQVDIVAELYVGQPIRVRHGWRPEASLQMTSRGLEWQGDGDRGGENTRRLYRVYVESVTVVPYLGAASSFLNLLA